MVPALATANMGERISIFLWVSLRYAQFSSDLSQFRSDLVTSVFNKRIRDGGAAPILHQNSSDLASFLVFPLLGAGFWGWPECQFCIIIAQIWLDKGRRFFNPVGNSLGWSVSSTFGMLLVFPILC